jgi:chromosome segregation ATPase
MIEDNENIEPNLFSEKQKTYELINDEINNSNHINIDISPSNNYNMQTPNNKLESNIYSQNLNNLNISINDNEENEEMEEDTEKEAVEFIQLQHQKIKKLKNELKMKNDIIDDYKEKFSKINSNFDNKENSILYKNLRQQNEILSKEKEELKLELYSKDKLIKELKIDLKDLSKKFSKINNNISSQSEEKNEKVNQLLQLIKEYSNQLKLNEEKIKLYENEFNKLNQNLTNEMKEKQKYKLLYDDKIAEDKNWIIQLNTDIQLLCDWMNNYMVAYFDNSVEIPDVPLFSPPINSENVITFNKFNLNLLRQTISEVRNKIYNKLSKYENIIQQDKKEQIELLNKIDSQNKNIALLNKDISNLKEEIIKKKVEIDEMNHKFNMILNKNE